VAAYKDFFRHFVRLTFFISLPYRNVQMTLSFLGYLVFEQTLISHYILFSIMCRLRHRRDYVEEKAVLM